MIIRFRRGGTIMKTIMKKCNGKLLSILLVLCMVLAMVPVTAFAADNYIDRISVTYTQSSYKAGDVPYASATVTEGNCSVAYEYWREIEQKEEGGVWTGTGRYWYSDSAKMASLSADKRITQFEAGHHYSYNIVIKTDSGYFISEDSTIVSVAGYEWGTPASSTNLEIKEMSTELRIYSPYSIDIPADSTDEVISVVDIGNIWKNLNSSQPVAFTAEVNSNNSACSGKIEIVEEMWEKSTAGESTPINDIIKSTDTPHNPIAGGEYWYSVVLKAKEGYVFSDNVTFICDGQNYTSNTAVSDGGKTFTAWEFMDPVTAKSNIDDIGDVDIEGVTFNYKPGDAPKATAYKCDVWDELYDIEYEYWEEMETNANGESVPVKYWYSDESKNNALAQGKKITTFEEGKTYMYSISLKSRDGNTFATNSKVMVNGETVNSANVTNTGTGLFVVAVRTIKPQTVRLQNISVVEINNATISFKAGDKPVFTGKTPENVPYIYQSEYWSTDGGKKYYYAADFWNENNPDDLFTEFESGKTYTYGIYFKAAEGYCFTTDTKLKINGKYYDYDITDYDPMLQYENGGYATMWVDTSLTITPQASSTTPSYQIIEGINGTWTQNTDGTLTFRANGEFSKFTGVKVDDKLIDAGNYVAASGSTIITLKTDYLKTLAAGAHKLTVVYTDGECSTNFEIKQVTKNSVTNPTNPASPKTGDDSIIQLWVVAFLVSATGICGTVMYERKKKYNR